MASISDSLFLRHEMNPALPGVHTFNFTSHHSGVILDWLVRMSGNDHDHSMHNFIYNDICTGNSMKSDLNHILNSFF